MLSGFKGTLLEALGSRVQWGRTTWPGRAGVLRLHSASSVRHLVVGNRHCRGRTPTQGVVSAHTHTHTPFLALSEGFCSVCT